jgi:2-methylcitrate dehydratase
MNTCEALADYAIRASWDDLTPEAQRKLKQHLLDSLGCALGALQAAPIRAIRTEGSPYREGGSSSTIGGEPTTSRTRRLL